MKCAIIGDLYQYSVEFKFSQYMASYPHAGVLGLRYGCNNRRYGVSMWYVSKKISNEA